MKLYFYKGKGKLFDKLIRWWTGGKYSHCELQFSDGISFSADAWENRVRFEVIHYNPANWDCVDVKLTAKEEIAVRAFCDSQEGKGYDWLGIIGFIFPLVVEDPLRWFCSEVCVEALKMVGKLKGVASRTVHPSSLARMYGLH